VSAQCVSAPCRFHLVTTSTDPTSTSVYTLYTSCTCVFRSAAWNNVLVTDLCIPGYGWRRIRRVAALCYRPRGRKTLITKTERDFTILDCLLLAIAVKLLHLYSGQFQVHSPYSNKDVKRKQFLYWLSYSLRNLKRMSCQ